MTTPTDLFADRHISLTDSERAKMLADLGYESAAALLEAAVPKGIQMDGPLVLPAALTETEALARLRGIADQNSVATSLIGMGWNDCITPPVIRRNMIENPAWYTAYTPYQPEISQGRLEMLLVFQTMVADLTGCELANASMLDEATAAAEAMTLLRRAGRSQSTGFFVDADCHPQTIAVVQTRAEPLGIDITVGDPISDLDASTVFGALLAQPGTSGRLIDVEPVIAALHDAGALAAVTTDLLACTLITPPGELGADVVVGLGSAIRCPHGFRRTPRRLHRHPREDGPFVARSSRRRVDRQRRQAGVPLGAADQGAAHPPREGDLEHLHRAGAAGQRGRRLRLLARPRRPHPDRPADP